MLARTTFFRVAVALGLTVATCLAGSAPALAGAARAVVDAANDPDDTTAALRDELFEDVNAERATAGLVRFVRDGALERIARDRVARLAASPTFSHLVAGAPILEPVEEAGIGPLGVGEDLGWSTHPGSAAFSAIIGMWEGSPSHRDVLLSDVSSYAGVGVALRGGKTYVVLVTAETLDRTPPAIRITVAERRAAAIVVRWEARDQLLQTHTAGVRDAAVEYRVDGGAWRTLQRANALGEASVRALRSGHAYEVRVRARDRAGNVSPWVETAPIRIP